MLNVLLVLYLSLETVSEVSARQSPPMMTRLLSWLTLQALEYSLFSVRVRGSVTQPPCCTLHFMQLHLAAHVHPPHSILPAWTWADLLSGSGGSSHVEFCHGRNISAPRPPVIRTASEMERLQKLNLYCHFKIKSTKINNHHYEYFEFLILKISIHSTVVDNSRPYCTHHDW